MTERGIIMGAGSALALLAGRKTQTRRLLRPQPDARTTCCSVDHASGMWMGQGPAAAGRGTSQWDPWRPLPWRVGDRLWVRERFTFINRDDEPGRGPEICIGYPADGASLPNRPVIPVTREAFDRTDAWPFQPRERSARHMPRWASRLMLTVAAVQIERLQDISEEDAVAEGIEVAPRAALDLVNGGYEAGYFLSLPDGRKVGGTVGSAATLYREVWGAMHGPRAWAKNPWVCALAFAVARRTIDAADAEAADA